MGRADVFGRPSFRWWRQPGGCCFLAGLSDSVSHGGKYRQWYSEDETKHEHNEKNFHFISERHRRFLTRKFAQSFLFPRVELPEREYMKMYELRMIRIYEYQSTWFVYSHTFVIRIYSDILYQIICKKFFLPRCTTGRGMFIYGFISSTLQ